MYKQQQQQQQQQHQHQIGNSNINSSMPQITCFKCGYEWTSRLESPKGCPKCGQRLDRKRTTATAAAPTPPEAAPVLKQRSKGRITKSAPEAVQDARSALDAALDHADIITAPGEAAAAPIASKADIIEFYAGWLELQFGRIKQDELKNQFHDALKGREREICAAFDIESRPGYLPYATLSAPIIKGIERTDPGKHNLKLQSMLTDLVNPELTRRRSKK